MTDETNFVSQEPKIDTSTRFIDSLIEHGALHLEKKDVLEEEVILMLVEKIKSLKKDEEALTVSLIGGAGAGKSTLADHLSQALSVEHISTAVIGTDDYVIGTRQDRRELEKVSSLKKYDFELLKRKIGEIRSMKSGEKVKVPTYDEATGLAVAVGEENYTREIGKVDVVIAEGDFRGMHESDCIVYVHVPDAIRLRNRIERDRQKRSEGDEQKITENFNHRQVSQHEPYTLPAAKKADVLLKVDTIENSQAYSYTIYTRK